MNPRYAVLVILVIAVAAILIYEPSGTTDDPDDDVPVDTADGIYAGPTFDPDMGDVSVTSFDGDTITFTAFPKDGYGFLYWTDTDGHVLTRSTSMTFPAIGDRDAVAVFGVEDGHVSEVVWHVPTFNPDGTVSFDRTAVLSMRMDPDAYRASLASDVQRSGTHSVPTPAGLCSVDGAMEDVVTYLGTYAEGLTNLQRAILVLSFVQDAVGYQLDRDQFGEEEFWATPFETLYSQYGDCEDTAVLFVSLASALGVESGLVMFDSDRVGTPDSGHLSVAVALRGSENVTGDAATFTLEGKVWAYGETAFDLTSDTDYRPLIGVLSTNYSLAHATFTPVTFQDGTFTGGRTISVPHGTSSMSGTVIYGSPFSDPPAVEMGVGDGFSYTPELSLPAVITASGDGLSWLTWDPVTFTLSGTATSPGTYTVLLEARSTVGPEQTAVQKVTVRVTAEGTGTDYDLVYGNGGWGVQSGDGESANNNRTTDDGYDWTDTFRVLAVCSIGCIAVVLTLRRFA